MRWGIITAKAIVIGAVTTLTAWLLGLSPTPQLVIFCAVTVFITDVLTPLTDRKS